MAQEHSGASPAHADLPFLSNYESYFGARHGLRTCDMCYERLSREKHSLYEDFWLGDLVHPDSA